MDISGIIEILTKIFGYFSRKRKRLVKCISTDKDKEKLLNFLEKYSNKDTVFYLNITLGSEMADELRDSNLNYFMLFKNEGDAIQVCFNEKEAIADLTSTSSRIRGYFICDTSGTKQGISPFVLKLQNKS